MHNNGSNELLTSTIVLSFLGRRMNIVSRFNVFFFAVSKSLNKHLFDINFDKVDKMYQLIFAISDYFQNLARHMKTKIILIHDVDIIIVIVTSCNIFHYLFLYSLVVYGTCCQVLGIVKTAENPLFSRISQY